VWLTKGTWGDADELVGIVIAATSARRPAMSTAALSNWCPNLPENSLAQALRGHVKTPLSD
jgi:hypothetical protein